MKFSKRRNRFEASNLALSIHPLEAISYGWWSFLRVIDGKIVFNQYRYSVTTQKHQRKVLQKLSDLGISIHTFVETHHSLHETAAIPNAIQGLLIRADTLEDETQKKGTRKSKNEQRLAHADLLRCKASTLSDTFSDWMRKTA